MSRVTRQSSRHAAPMRASPTEAERRIWHAVRDRRLDGLKFRRQASIGPYIVDFLCSEAMLVVEVDGDQHFIGQGLARDAVRTAFLEAQGYRVVRFGSRDALLETANVLETVLGVARERIVAGLGKGAEGQLTRSGAAAPESPLPQAGEGA